MCVTFSLSSPIFSVRRSFRFTLGQIGCAVYIQLKFLPKAPDRISRRENPCRNPTYRGHLHDGEAYSQVLWAVPFGVCGILGMMGNAIPFKVGTLKTDGWYFFTPTISSDLHEKRRTNYGCIPELSSSGRSAFDPGSSSGAVTNLSVSAGDLPNASCIPRITSSLARIVRSRLPR